MFADGLNIPIGVLPLADRSKGRIVHTIPNICLLVARRRRWQGRRREVLLSRVSGSETPTA